jgi:hypothetical protein
MYQSHNKSFCSASVTAGSVVLHSTLATRELSSSCSNPPPSANHRCSDAPATLRSSLSFPTPFTPPHGLPPLVELQLVQLGESSHPASSPRRAAVAIREAADHSTERRTSTRVHLLVEQNSYRSRSHSVTYVRHPSSYYPANCACNSPSQASRRVTAAPPSITDCRRPPSDPLAFN